MRQTLETLHSPGATDAVAKAWPYLGHADRHIRFAARTAVELQPVASWQDKALAENTNNDAKINALLALARCGDKSLQGPLLTSMGQLNTCAIRRCCEN